MTESGNDAKVAIVTGSNAGIGRATAQGLAERGYNVVLACRNKDAAAAACEAITSQLPQGSGTVTVGAQLDLASQASVRSFVQWFQSHHPSLHLLVNNAGCNWIKPYHTEDNVFGMVQVNYLGPFYLTRLLEQQLSHSRARVVNLSSCMHRLGRITDVDAFLSTAEQGTYGNTKLAKVMFSNELQRRSNGRIECASVDPGGVATAIFENSAFGKGLGRMFLTTVFQPPSEGCQAVLHAATMPWQPSYNAQAPFLARGLFASPGLTGWGSNKLFPSLVRATLGGPWAVLDQPLRSLTGGRLGMSTARVVPPNEATRDEVACGRLWQRSSEMCKLPSELSL